MSRTAGEGSERAPSLRLRRRRLLARGAAIVVSTILASSAGLAAMDELEFFRIGTAATTGTYFQIGGLLAGAISKPPGSRDCEHGGSCGVPGLVAVAQASQGSIQNVLAVSAGQLESAFAQSDVAYWAYTGGLSAPRHCGAAKEEAAARNTGTPPPKPPPPLKNLRVIAALYPEEIHVVVRADSTIRNLRDLKGRRVALGEPESGTLADARLVMEAAGINECDIKAAYLRLSEASDALIQGRIDAFFYMGGYPVPAITDTGATIPTRLVPIPPDAAERLARRFSFFTADAIPGGTYRGIDSATPTVSTMALWLVREETRDDLVYAITKALWSDATRRLLSASPVGVRIRLADAFDGVAIPFHPGAARFYREAGLKLPEGQ
jgi:TRAP transporter TAXI family solute receptor